MQTWPTATATLIAALSLTGCGDSGTGPSDSATLSIGAVQPAGLAAAITATGTPPGASIARGSGQVSIPVTFTVNRDVSYGQLNVYLLTADGYCGQNLPDAPTWGPVPRGRAQNVTITGFQVYRVPCDVTGVRAMLHQRNNGLLVPPNASETIAEATRPVSWTIR